MKDYEFVVPDEWIISGMSVEFEYIGSTLKLVYSAIIIFTLEYIAFVSSN